ncbi:Ig lambda chain V-I region WAH [Poecilia latipinna]|uniref:Ig lambda chain V-I region WAH n=1 Tax=Poecilia latipinna TaxID=48699 RepID=UPI003D7CE5C2
MNKLFRKQVILQFLASFLWISGFAGGSDVTQPSVLWKNKSEDATIDCSHKKGELYFQMYWFRQLPGKTMELVVFTTTGSSKHDFGSFSQEKFSATKAKAESGALTVKSLEPADEGLYFCAVGSAQRCRRQEG